MILGPPGLGPLSPHIQQNGFQPLPPPNPVGPAGYRAQPQQPPPAPMVVSMTSQQPGVVGPVAVAGPPSAGVSGQGTWTGNSTLTYTQTMQPPDPRSHHPGFWPHQTPMQQHDMSMQTALSSQPVPEFWCSIAYFELDTQVTAVV